MIRFWDLRTGQPGGTGLPFQGDEWLIISPDGHYRGTPGLEAELVYVVQTEEGQQTVTPKEWIAAARAARDPGAARRNKQLRPRSGSLPEGTAWDAELDEILPSLAEDIARVWTDRN